MMLAQQSPNQRVPGMTHLLRRRSNHTDRHFVSTASCVKTTLALSTKKLGCHEIETNISSAYENWAIFCRCKLLIVFKLLHLKRQQWQIYDKFLSLNKVFSKTPYKGSCFKYIISVTPLRPLLPCIFIQNQLRR